MLERVIERADRGRPGRRRAARACGIPTGGAMPKGFLTEDGPRPEFDELYGARELWTADYPTRTARNVMDAPATHRRARWAPRDTGRPGTPASTGSGRCSRSSRARRGPSDVVAWLEAGGFRSLNVAGNRESGNPGIGERAERFLLAVFRQLAQR